MIIAGLTGSLAMGKSETAKLFIAQGVPVFDSDSEVHRLYEKGGEAVSLIEREFPSAIVDGVVDRRKLSNIVISEPQAFAKLESLVHPLVERARTRFINDLRMRNEKLAILDIPLLFETGLDRHVDKVIVVTAPLEVQRQRAMARDGMSREKFETILSRQIPDVEKRSKADFIVDTSRGPVATANHIGRIVAQLRSEAE